MQYGLSPYKIQIRLVLKGVTMVQGRLQWMLINLRVPQKMEKFLAICKISNFSKRTQLHGAKSHVTFVSGYICSMSLSIVAVT